MNHVGLLAVVIMIEFEELEAKGWRKVYQPLDDEYPCYEKEVDGLFLDLTKGLSNTVGSDWTLHADNEDRESVGNIDVKSYDDVIRFIQLLKYDDDDTAIEYAIQEEADKRYPDLEYDADMYRYHGFIEGARWLNNYLKTREL